MLLGSAYDSFHDTDDDDDLGSESLSRDELVEELAMAVQHRWPNLDVAVNPSYDQQHEVEGFYPNVISFDPDTDEPAAIFEIEVEETITARAARTRWLPLSELEVPLWIVVPDESWDEAGQLIDELDIEATLITYEIERGGVFFGW